MTLPRYITATIILFVLTIGCRPSPVAEERPEGLDYVIVEADNNYELTMAELEQELKQSPLFPQGGIVDTASISGVLDSIVCDTLAGMAAADVKLDDYYESFRLFRLRYYDDLIGNYFQQTVYGKVVIDSQAVVDFYYSRPDLFSIDEHVYLYHIFITPRGIRRGPDSLKYEFYSREQLEEEAEKLMRKIYSEIESPQDFLEAAFEYSHDTITGRKGGLVGWSKRGVYVDPFDSVAFSLEPGDISRPYQDGHGWHLLYCEDRMPEGIPELNETTYGHAVENYSITEANRIGRELVDTLFKNIDVRYNERLLDTNLYQVDVQQWVAIVNGQDTIDCNDARAAELQARQDHAVANTNAEQKKAMLQKAAERLVLVQAARNLKIDTLPTVREAEAGLRQKYRKAIVQRELRDVKYMPPDSAIEAYYNQHLDEFQPEKPLVVQHILVQDSLFGDFLRGQAMSGYDFLDLAEAHYVGDSAVRRELADLGEINQDDVPESFWEAAEQTILGEVSYPVKTEYGYHIIKLLERREARTLNQARPRIIEILKEKHHEELFEAFKNKMYKRFHVKRRGPLVPVHLDPLSMRG